MNKERVEYYKEKAKLGAPDGYVYVGAGREGGLEFGGCLSFFYSPSEGGLYCGDSPWCDYICPLDVWERVTGLCLKEKTLSEVKAELKEAQKLIGRQVSNITGQPTFTVKKVELLLEEKESLSYNSYLFLQKHGYVINLQDDSWCIPYGGHKISEESFKLTDSHSAEITKNGVEIEGTLFSHEKILELAEAVKRFQS